MLNLFQHLIIKVASMKLTKRVGCRNKFGMTQDYYSV